MSFEFEFTEEKLKKCVSKNKNIHDLYEALNTVLPKYEINTVDRVAAFLAQCGHESLDFTVLQENLNYGAKGLMGLFKKYFPNEALAKEYERKPEKIANKIYANRMGNGPESSGDGWAHRGRGAIQLTGKLNYQAFANSIGLTLDDAIHYCETMDGAIESACWFWNKNKLNAIADKNDIVLLTKKINGGTIGLEDRKKHWEHNKEVLAD
jgi:putative chitinase